MSILTTLGNEPDITLPAPQIRQNGMSLDMALKDRRSVREFDPTLPLSLQQISNILWAACGMNRPEEGKFTNPTAMNTQEISVYVFDNEAAYLYIPQTNVLRKVAPGDHRDLIAGTAAFNQDFVKDAPISILIVADYGKFEMPDDRSKQMALIDGGIVCENINLYCIANGLATVPRATMDVAALTKLLKLTEKQLPILNNPIGYERH
ncbi:MAG: SagB/ThcOx family dehydrogenase [Clostridium sp.]|nr:SagB/ThcOx family dehydrogenase [Prevotella sp.]MCM1429342.1 SagB/ThcOx family dehydrogenase [Clostridium sp.]MCM1475624.1 SagB/ThcOx family dehydrogenase [Muribaculaceae bacterium]